MAKKTKATAANQQKQTRKKFVTGMIIIMLGLLSLVAIVSFLFTGGADRSIFDLSFWELLSNTDLEVRNTIGKLGAWFADMVVTNGVGLMALAIPVLLVGIGLKIMGMNSLKMWPFVRTLIIVTIWGSITLGFVSSGFANSTYTLFGGTHGYFVARWLTSSIGNVGVAVLLLATLLIYLIFKVEGFQAKLTKMFEFFAKRKIKVPAVPFDPAEGDDLETEPKAPENQSVSSFSANANTVVSGNNNRSVEPEQTEPSSDPEPENDFKTSSVQQPAAAEQNDIDIDPVDAADDPESNNFVINEGSNETTVGQNLGNLTTPFDPTLELSHYRYPTFDLLVDYEKQNGDDAPDKIEERRIELESNKNKIVETLDQFKIGVQKIEATIGPTVTLYEIVPTPGVKISRIQSLENDIALSLAALCVRIIAPIPGKGTIGIEVPNSKPKIVSMLSVLKSSAYQNSKYELPVVLGKTISNETFVFDLAKAPHLLVAGATGQGKSVGLNVLLTSLLYKKHPSQVKLVLVDPKMVEFSMYSKLEKYFLAKRPSEKEPIITDSENAKAVLNSLVQEMEDRYALIKGIARNIKEYNEKFIRRELNPEHGHKFLPYIVVIIDEYGDLVMVAGKDIETPITRIAQKARAVGIHMVLATQRPSTNVVTGIIKANFPSRIAFRVTNMVDSRTVLDVSGAQHLIGRGDMLASISGSTTTRVQCALVDTDEVIRINDFISQQQGYAEAFALPDGMEGEGGDMASGEPLAPGDFDPMIGEAARLVIRSDKGSTSTIQRSLSLGFNRAGRVMDQLERMGIVGPQEKPGKPRDVYVHSESELESIFNNFKVKF